MSCKKNSSNIGYNPDPRIKVYGVYTSISGTKTVVSHGPNGTISLKYIPNYNNLFYLFERAAISTDLTFTILEDIRDPTNPEGTIREYTQYIGTGYFKNDTIHYDALSISDNTIIQFEGVK